MTLAQFLAAHAAGAQAPPKVLTLAQLQKQSRQLYFPFPVSRKQG